MRHHGSVLRQERDLKHTGPIVYVALQACYSHGRNVFHGIARYVSENPHWRLVVTLDRFTPDPRSVAHCDALIASFATDATLEMATRLRVPFVNVGERHHLPRGGWVHTDGHAAGHAAAVHLLRNGIRELAYLGDGADHSNRIRLDGVQSALPRGAQVASLPTGMHLGEDAWNRLKTALVRNRKPLGIVCHNESVAHLLAQLCWEAGLAVPDEIAIVSLGEDPLLCPSSYVPLTSVELNTVLVGYRAAALLDQMLARRIRTPREIVVPIGGLVCRRSTDTLQVDHPALARALRHMRAHACDPCTVRDVCRAAALSRRSLERLCRQVLSCSPHDWLLRERLRCARELLLDGNLKIPDVAERAGFGYESNMRRAFLRSGLPTPAQYRREQQGVSSPSVPTSLGGRTC